MLCTGNHLKLTIFICTGSMTCGNWLEKKGSLRSTSKCYLPCRCSASPRLTMSCVLGSRMVQVSTQCSTLSRRQGKEHIIQKDLTKRRTYKCYCSYTWGVHA